MIAAPPSTPRVAAPIDFAALFARSPNPYVVVAADLTIVWMNDAYLAVTMRERGDLLGRRMFEAFPSDPKSESHRLLSRSLERVKETGEADEIALIRYDIARPDGGMDVRYWSATHTPLRDEQGAVAFILQHTVDVTELHGLRRLRDEMGVVQRAQAVQARNTDLTEETSRLHAMFEQAPGFVAILTGAEHRFVVANRAYRTLVGKRDLVGRSVAEALPEVVEQGFIALLDQVCRTGQPYLGSRVEIYLGGPEERHFLDFVYQPMIEADGSTSGVFVQGHDVTDQVEAEERQRLLINELNHRVKNTLSIVQGLALQSFRKVADAAPAEAAFNARLSALASAHNLLTEQDWDAAILDDIVSRSVEATAGQDAARIHLSGPRVTLPPQTAVSLAMIVHELSTNAIKYGALSTAAGRVDVAWQVEPDDGAEQLTITWIESAGPRVTLPEKRGFGTRLIQKGLSSELRGTVQLEFDPGGLRCTIRARLAPEAA